MLPKDSAFWKQDWFFGLVLLVVTFLAYQPLWHAGYTWDDELWVMSDPAFRNANSVFGLWFHPATLDYFPMTSTSFWMEWRLWGNNPLGYHLVNVLWHSLSAVLLWRVLLHLKIPGAWLAAAIFALHPVNVESVAWIAEQKNTLCMVFFLVSLLFYLRSDDFRRGTYWLSVLAFGLALLSKPAVVALPFVLLSIAWWRNGRVTRMDVLRSVPFFVIAGVLGLVAVSFQHQTIGTEVIRTDSFWGRLAGAGWAVWFYLGKITWPLGLVSIYPRWRIDATALASYVPILLLVVAFLVSWIWRARWGKVLLFGFGYFVLMLLPVIGFLNISFMKFSLVADRYQYFSIIGPAALAAAGVTIALDKWKEFLLPHLAKAILLVVLGVLTWRHSGIYADTEKQWRSNLALNPDCWAVSFNLGDTLDKKGRIDEAISRYRESIRLKPDSVEAHGNLGSALLKKGQTAEAITQFQEAIRLKPASAEVHFNLGNVLLKQGQTNEAISHLRDAVRFKPGVAEGHYILGNALFGQSLTDEAIFQFKEAARLQPDYAEAHNNLGVALVSKGQIDEAILQFKETVRLKPDYAETRCSLGNLLLQKGQIDEAIFQFKETVRLKPDYTEAHYNLGFALYTREQLDEAIIQFKEVLRLNPDDGEARNYLRDALAKKEQRK